jgi:hypothetical protein
MKTQEIIKDGRHFQTLPNFQSVHNYRKDAYTKTYGVHIMICTHG